MKKEKCINFFYRLIMLFLIGCILGCLFETILCYFQRGHFESRRGLIYGPLNPVYGTAVAAICLILKKEKKSHIIFFKGFFYGGVIEYLCSWVQETIFKTTSWNYSDYYFNFDGRTSIYHMIWWGVGTLLVIKHLYPQIIKLINKVKEEYRLVITVVISIFLLVDILISSFACIRYYERLNNIAPANNLDRIIDKYYPNDRLIKVYPNIKDAKTQTKLSKMK